MALRVLLADPWTVVRQAVRGLLEQEGITVACETADGKDAVELWRTHHPDVVILDFQLARVTGLDVARKLLQEAPDTAIIFLTLHVEEPWVSAALQAGVRGYVEKNRAPEDLMPAIRTVVRGGVYVSPPIDHPRATNPEKEGGENRRSTETFPPDATRREMAASVILRVLNYVVLPICACLIAA